jgi:hypothetical protein
MIEEETLRGALRSYAEAAVPAGTLRATAEAPVRSPASARARRRWIPAVAAAAVLGAVALVAYPLSSGAPEQPAAEIGAPDRLIAVTKPNTVTIFDSRTGRKVADVAVRGAADPLSGFAAVGAAGDGRTFYVEVDNGTGRGHVDELVVGTDASVSRRTVAGAEVLAGEVVAVAPSKDGRRLAVSVCRTNCANGDEMTNPGSHTGAEGQEGALWVFDLAAGTNRSWTGSGSAVPAPLSWDGTSGLLGYSLGAAYAVLDVTSGVDHSYTATRRIPMPQQTEFRLVWPTLAPDGATVYAVAEYSELSGTQNARFEVVRFPIDRPDDRTVIVKVPGRGPGVAWGLSLAPDAEHLLYWGPQGNNGTYRVDAGRTRKLPIPADAWASTW